MSPRANDKKCKSKTGDKFRKTVGEMRKKLDNEKNRKFSRRIGSARNEVEGVKIKRQMNVAFQGPNKLISINEFSENEDEEENQGGPISHAVSGKTSPLQVHSQTGLP